MKYMKALTINLSDVMEQRLQEVSQREHRTPEETACEILRKRLILEKLQDLYRESEPLFRAAGYESEEDILRSIS
jgi:predicted transcriptional regulator